MRIFRFITVIILLIVFLCGAAFAEGKKISIALSGGAFFPIDSKTKDTFDNAWTRVNLTAFEPEKPTHWRFIAEIGAFRLSGDARARLFPITAGFERALNENRRAQPYIAFRGGPCWSKVEQPAIGLKESKVGLNLNAAYGVIFNQRFYAEARYDFFSTVAGYDFDGISLAAGVKLFDIKL